MINLGYKYKFVVKSNERLTAFVPTNPSNIALFCLNCKKNKCSGECKDLKDYINDYNSRKAKSDR